MPWAIAYVAPNTELKLRDWLLERDQNSYVPTGESTLKLRHKRKPQVIVRVVFGCYVFIEEPIDWGLFRMNPPGLRRMLAIDGEVLRLQDAEIDAIKSLQAVGGFNGLKEPETLIFEIGDNCEIVDGVFVGQLASVQKRLKSLNGLIEVSIGNVRAKISPLYLKKKERA